MNEKDDKTQIPEISPLEAMEILQSGKPAVLLDVRSKVEFDYVGHPIGAVNIPWQEAPSWSVIPDFTGRVKKALSENHPGNPEELTILALCRSGARSRNAAQALKQVGFTKVYNIMEGFEGNLDENKHRGNIGGWRFHKLPWEQT